MITALIFILILAVLVVVHEFGHFIVAKKSGIRVDEFGVGFPPKLAGKKFGETEYTINAIPLGGFVKIFGEDGDITGIHDASEYSRSFVSKSKWTQAAVLLAGVTFNIIFAYLVLVLGFSIGLPIPNDQLHYAKDALPTLSVAAITAGSPAEIAGIRAQDTIALINGVRPKNADEVANTISDPNTTSVNLGVIHAGEKNITEISVTPLTGLVPGKKAIGMAMDSVSIVKLPFFKAIAEAFFTTISMIKDTVKGLSQLLWGILTFQSNNFKDISGPVGIASTVGVARHLGFSYLLMLVAIISINLAVVNLVPFPALDGGRLLMVFVEAITRRRIPAKVSLLINGIGFTLLLILMLFVTVHDVIRLF